MSVFLDDEEPAPLADEDVFALVAGSSLSDLHMSRSLEQIDARARVHHRRRTAAAAMAGVAAVTVLGAAAAFALPSRATHAVSTVDGATLTVTGAPGMTDPDWTLTADATDGYHVEITALGDTDRLNATLASLGIKIRVAESTPSGSSSACPTADGASQTTYSSGTATGTTPASPTSTGTATSTATSTPTSTDTLDTPTTPAVPTPTPVSFTVPGTPAVFGIGRLPKKSEISFFDTAGGHGTLLGTVSISEACLPVFGTT